MGLPSSPFRMRQRTFSVQSPAKPRLNIVLSPAKCDASAAAPVVSQPCVSSSPMKTMSFLTELSESAATFSAWRAVHQPSSREAGVFARMDTAGAFATAIARIAADRNVKELGFIVSLVLGLRAFPHAGRIRPRDGDGSVRHRE